VRSRIAIAIAVLVLLDFSASAALAVSAHALAARVESAHASSPGVGIALDFGLPALGHWPQFVLSGLVQDESAADPFRHLTGSQALDPETGQVLQVKPVRFGALGLVIDPDELDPRSGNVESSRFAPAVGLSEVRMVLPDQMVRMSPAAFAVGPFELLARGESGGEDASAPGTAPQGAVTGLARPGADPDDDLCPVTLMKLELGVEDASPPPGSEFEPDVQSCLRPRASADDGGSDRPNEAPWTRNAGSRAAAEMRHN
jgi:hypothetical protein